MNQTLKYFSLIGSGHAANFFAAYLPYLGLCPSDIWGRNTAQVQVIANDYSLNRVEQIEYLAKPHTLVMICTPDETIYSISAKIQPFEGVLAHCSGATSLDAISQIHRHRAVIWPMASLSGFAEKNVNQVFVSIEDTSDLIIKLFAQSQVQHGIHKSTERLQLHLAAVLANNFTHHLMYQVALLSERAHVPLQIYKNLALQALQFNTSQELYNAQTGPSRRVDNNTTQNHVKILNNPELKMLYEAFNQSIKKTYGTEL